MDDVRAVMDAVGSERAALFGISEGGAMSMLFAATYPERTQALVLYGTYAAFPHLRAAAGGFEAFLDADVETSWGTGASLARLRAVEGRGRAFPAMVGALRAAGRQPVGGARAHAHEQRASTSAISCRRSASRRSSCIAPATRASTSRAAAISRSTSPARKYVELPGDRSRPVGRRRRPHRRRDGGIPDRRARPTSSPTASSRP